MYNSGDVMSVIVMDCVVYTLFVHILNPFITALTTGTPTTRRTALSVTGLVAAMVVVADIVVIAASAAARIAGAFAGGVTAGTTVAIVAGTYAVFRVTRRITIRGTFLSSSNAVHVFFIVGSMAFFYSA